MVLWLQTIKIKINNNYDRTVKNKYYIVSVNVTTIRYSHVHLNFSETPLEYNAEQL